VFGLIFCCTFITWDSARHAIVLAAIQVVIQTIFARVDVLLLCGHEGAELKREKEKVRPPVSS
jgi:hypothetical protein